MYDRFKAIEYAKLYYNKRNPLFYAFDKLGGDCTNYISQCLWASGQKMNYFPTGWFYTNLTDRSASWTGVDEFFEFVTTNQGDGPRARVVNMSELMVGDVVQLGNDKGYFHTLLVNRIEYPTTIKSIYVTAHDRDCYDRSLDSYIFKTIRFLHILD